MNDYFIPISQDTECDDNGYDDNTEDILDDEDMFFDEYYYGLEQ